MKKYLLLTIFAFYAFSIHCQENRNKMNTERLTYFSFDHHNSMVLYAGEKYEVSTAGDGRVLVVIDEGFPGEKRFYLDDSVIFDELLTIVKAYKMDEYGAYYQPEIQVFDGDSWNLYYKYDSRRTVSSGGYMAWPDNYHDARHALSNYFKKWREYQDGVLVMDYFKFTCKNNRGRDIEYVLERGADEALLTIRDAEKGIDLKTTVSNDQLDNLQRVANAAQLKNDIYDYHTDDENATRCTYYVRYNTGDTISGYTCHTQYPGRKETAIFDFFSHWQ